MKFVIILFIFFKSFAAQQPPLWGGNPVYTVNVQMLYNKPIMKWNFTYYYDANKHVERYEHQAPHADEMCLWALAPFKREDTRCNVIFATDGWGYVEYPEHNFCCKCTKAFGAVKYDWLKENSSYVGVETINNTSVTHWTKMGIYLNHYYSTVDNQLPKRFFQIKDGNPKSWDFDLKSYNTGPIDPKKFSPPCTQRCLGPCDLFGMKQHKERVVRQ